MINWDSIKDQLVDSKVREELQKKGYQPPVITALMPFGAPALWMMDKIDDNTFGKVGNENKLGKSKADLDLYREAAESLRVLGRNNPAFATSVAKRYQANSDKYENDARTFANEMYDDPALCRKVIELARAEKITELEKVAKNPGQYMAAQAVKPAAAPVPPSPAQPAQPSPTTSGNNKDRKKPTKPAATTNVPVPAPAAPPTVPDEIEPENYTSEEAKAKFSKWMRDPKNEKLSKKIAEKEGLRNQLEKRLEENPNLVRNFMSKGNMAMYQSFLDKGDVNGFMNEFGGPVVTEAIPKMTMDGQFKDILGGMLGPLGSMFEGLFGSNEKAGSFQRIFEGLGDPNKHAATVSMGTGAQIERALFGPNRDYALGLIRNLEGNLRAPLATGDHVKDPAALSKHGENGLKGLGLTEEQIKVLKGDAHMHVDVKMGTDGRPVLVDGKPVFTVAKVDGIEKLVQGMGGASSPSRPGNVQEPPKPDYTVDRLVRDAMTSGAEKDEFGRTKLPSGIIPAGPQVTGAETFPVK